MWGPRKSKDTGHSHSLNILATVAKAYRDLSTSYVFDKLSFLYPGLYSLLDAQAE